MRHAATNCSDLAGSLEFRLILPGRPENVTRSGLLAPLTGRPAILTISGLFFEPALIGLRSSISKGRTMAVPKRRQSNSRTNRRRAHDAKKPKQLTFCPKCSSALPTHVVCPKCGYYMGRVVVETSEE